MSGCRELGWKEMHGLAFGLSMKHRAIVFDRRYVANIIITQLNYKLEHVVYILFASCLLLHSFKLSL